MIKNMRRFLLMVLVLVLTVAPNNALAATTLDPPCTNLSASIGGSSHSLGEAYKGESSAGTVSMVVSCLRSAMNGTLTLTNSGTEMAVLSFSYTVSGTYNTCTIDGTAASASGTYTAELASNGSVAIYLEVPGWKKATVNLTNVKLEVAGDAKVTVSRDGPGTISIDGTTVDSGSTVEINKEGAMIAATPDSGAVFLGWINTADNSVVFIPDGSKYVPTGDISLKAIFASPTTEARFWGSAKAYLFESLSAAITHASNASNKTVILAASGTLYSGSYTIPSGVTLLAPFDANGTLYTTSPGYVEDSYTTPSVYSTLTMASGANIIVNGAVSVSAVVSAKMGYAGAPTSKYGHIDMNEGSSITVNSGGNLYAWGYITGSGNVTIKSGATVYESFQVVDWRGGTASSGMLNNSKKVFPITQYYVQNVEAPMTLEYGASEKCSMVADIISVRQVTVKFLGTSGCMFNLNSGSITKRYDGSKDRLILDFDGELSVSQTEISLILSYSIKTQNYVLPLTNNMTISVHKDSVVTFDQTTSLLPGVQMTIDEGGTVKLGSGKQLFVYDETEWKAGKYVYSDAYFRPVRYAHSKTYTRTADKDIIDAKILVNGTLDASAGYLYTTSGGANICSTANGVVKVQAAEASPTLYEATQSGTSISYSSISIDAAKLKNRDDTYTETAGVSTVTTYYYCADCGFWVTAKDPVAQVIGGTSSIHYHTLAEAVTAYGDPAAGKYIQMLGDTGESVALQAKTALDLNGKKITGTTTISGAFYGADTSGNGYTVPSGSIKLSAAPSTIAHVNDRNYVAYTADDDNADSKTYSFHRFAITPNAYQFYFNPNGHSHLVFEAVAQGDKTVCSMVKDLGFTVTANSASTTGKITTTTNWYSVDMIKDGEEKATLPETFATEKTVFFAAVQFDDTASFDVMYTVVAIADFSDDHSSWISSAADNPEEESHKITFRNALEQYLDYLNKQAELKEEEIRAQNIIKNFLDPNNQS